MRFFFLFTFFFSISSLAYSFHLTFDQKMSDLEQLINLIKSDYGPLDYKKERFDLDVDLLHSKYRNLIEIKGHTNHQFYYLLIKLVAEFHDGHFQIYIPTSHQARLNMNVSWVNGKVLISSVDRDKLSEEDFPFYRGDEIIAIDGVSVDEILDELVLYSGEGNEQTDRAYAAYNLVRIHGERFPIPNEKKTTFTIKRRESVQNAEEQVQLEWEMIGVPLDEHSSFDHLSFKGHDLLNPHQSEWLYEEDDSARLQFLQNSSKKHRSPFSLTNKNRFIKLWDDNDYLCSGESRIDLPDGAEILISPEMGAELGRYDMTFMAYHFPIDTNDFKKGHLGYIRIPHYNFYENTLSQYRGVLSVLEETTLGLIIDQDHNCGGYIDKVHDMVNLFMKDEWTSLQFSLISNRSSYLNQLIYLNSLPYMSSIYQHERKVTKLIRNHWLGEDRMTERIHEWADNTQGEAIYTKPILILIDFWSGSGGDAFPALMQGHGRAKLFGTTTMGLGGHVSSMPPLSNSGMKIQMTRSLFFRPDEIAIENNGVVPDYPYTITYEDFMGDFQFYRKAYTEKILEMIAM